ncbi:hypothetical protein CO173_03660 [Candidatus Uhrbacteria bacterium CG_4_9_14_3_um_filter_41_35]|uniref:Uncharacterized protein n=1 Tax=Candidatus Uhrbacteria bacterium CG_4_9_14_3_um_filter_41_35 TaxID=1975034 RepID=A0A2M7XDZ2_9BACT|nr:MAG: hypothetical protein COV92_02090 [Candidatus Uhrbacteria bacterium CG11_big_fil_rev_8_21_14_0_20_41_9]PJA46110.1 MAG: hypothetical protein CO173_03660 [Candidatus Uhrbacteria bacterium CG_4_9_14_3_um_filter_41_35]
MAKQGKKSRLLGGLLAVASGIIHILSLPPVRNYIWSSVMKKGENVIDVKVKESTKKKGWFR